MSQYYCPKVALNTAIPVLIFFSSLARHFGYFNTCLTFILYLIMVASIISGWLVQPTKLLYNMVKHLLGFVSKLLTMKKKDKQNSFQIASNP